MTSVIASGARTPIGKLSGGLAGFAATDLGGVAIAAALERASVAPADVDYVIMGQVLQAGAGQATARRAAADADIPLSVPATTINKVCLSGINAIYLAHRMIEAGDADIVVAGGMESMSNAPYLLPGARAGFGAGDRTVVDSLFHDGLFCALESCLMGEGTERYAATAGLERAPQDELAAASHERAARATKDGVLAEEIVPVTVPQRRGEPILVSDDEGIRSETTAESLGQLRPAFADAGNITAGNASQISDGASATVVMSAARAEAFGLDPLGEIVGYGQVAGPDPSLLSQPSNAIVRALAGTALSVDDIDLFEINEAFAAVAVASMADLGVAADVVNVNGGAIALGHPIGASGNRLVLTLLHELRRRGGGHGAAALCGGGGQGDALIVRTP
ncbi:MAG: acetyl-CoA C-acyltransferase [Acidimicrobiia bacterium]|nr:acetyl-CoA C-acyltransferase [Acidimicrobiia bacterium]